MQMNAGHHQLSNAPLSRSTYLQEVRKAGGITVYAFGARAIPGVVTPRKVKPKQKRILARSGSASAGLSQGMFDEGDEEAEQLATEGASAACARAPNRRPHRPLPPLDGGNGFRPGSAEAEGQGHP